MEDFAIVADLGTSLRRASQTRASVVTTWVVLGWTWCGLQIASLLPGTVGVAAGVLALPVWADHWVYTVLIGRRLSAAAPA